MKVLVLGGCGLQGKAVLQDLSRSPQVKEIVCADVNPKGLEPAKKYLDMTKIKIRELDARDKDALLSVMKDGIDVVIDVLPIDFLGTVAEAALEAEVHLVNTLEGHMMPDDLHERAVERGLTIMPESGLDPGIDLILCGYGASEMDEVLELHSYCGGIPEVDAANNPLKYKITWTWDGVLLSYKLPARIMRDGEIIDIPAKDQFARQWIGRLDFPGVGELEAILNGDAIIFAEHLGIVDTVKNTTRCSLRWPGHSEFWKKLVDLNFLSDEPVNGLPFKLTPHQFMVKHLEPQLQYEDDERDLVIMRNVIIGIKEGKMTKIIFDLLDKRDMETGLFAMNRTVGYTASIVAQMIATGEINRRGLLTAVRDIPYKRFLEEIRKRGIKITKRTEVIEKG